MNTKNDYPTSYIISLYALLGGVIGGLIFNIGLSLAIVVEQIAYQRFDMSLQSVGSSVMGGIFIMIAAGIFGMPSAFLTGLTIGLRKYKIASFKDYLKISVIGAVYSAFIILLFFPRMDSIKLALMFGVIGGLSAVILAKLVVPKAKSL